MSLEQGQAAVDFIKSRCSPVIAENDRLRAEVDRLKQMIHDLRSEIAIRDTELDGMRMELANRQIERME